MPTPEARHRRATSLRTRLTVWVVAIFVVLQIVIGAAFWYFQRRSNTNLFEKRFHDRAVAIAQELGQRLPGVAPGELSRIAREQLGTVQFEQFALDVVDADGVSVIAGRTTWPRTSARVAPRALQSRGPVRTTITGDQIGFTLDADEQAELIAVPVPQASDARPVVLIAVTTDAYIGRQSLLIARVLVFGGLLGMVASGLSGWFISGIAVAPLKRMSAVAGQLRPETIDQELVVDARAAEVNELASELEEARARIREGFAAQERFLSNISHEIKTPIATLLVESQTIDRTGLPQPVAEFMGAVEDEMRKLGKLVESFLTLTRVRDAGDLMHLREYPANELVMDAVEDCLPMAAQHGVRLMPRLAADDAGLDATLRGDPELLRTMLNNLIRNAIRFAPQGTTVEVHAFTRDRKFVVAVTDHGPGLPPELLERVFDRFVQSSDEVRRKRGHGLGLAIAKGIAELHKGDIRVRNVEPSGARFEIQIPISAGPPEAHPNSAAAPRPRGETPSDGRPGQARVPRDVC